MDAGNGRKGRGSVGGNGEEPFKPARFGFIVTGRTAGLVRFGVDAQGAGTAGEPGGILQMIQGAGDSALSARSLPVVASRS